MQSLGRFVQSRVYGPDAYNILSHRKKHKAIASRLEEGRGRKGQWRGILETVRAYGKILPLPLLATLFFPPFSLATIKQPLFGKADKGK